MLYLLQPAWLAAAAAIAFPVILHLWNDRRGKVLRIGSIAMLAGASQRMSWSRRLSQWWLLLLRCLLLLALAVLLAGPYWRHAAGAGKGWVLEVGPRGDGAGAADGAGADAVYRPLIDSLVKAGYERHLLEDSLNYWDGFRVADRQAPAGVPFYIFTTALAGRFSGERPLTDRVVHWYTYAPMDSVHHWIQRAWSYGSDSIRLLTGSSRSTGTFYRRESVAAGSPLSVPVDTAVLRVTIYTDPAYQEDGRYIAAAVRALQTFTRRRIQLSVGGGMGGGDWLFWLSARPLPLSLRGTFKHVLQYEQGKDSVVDTRVEGIELMKEVDGAAASLAERSAAGQTPVWRDGYGRGVLSREANDNGGFYHFYSRFDPNWNGLVWSRRFPVLFERLIFGEDAGVPAEDRRVLDPGQMVPVRGGEVVRPAVEERKAIDLAPLLWVLILLLFILERVVSFSTTPVKANG